MAQQHLDRLTSQDATFLHQESANAHMHVGGVALFEGPAPSFTEFVDHIRGRLHLVPRYRQRLAVPPGGSGRPLWIDDPNFNLEFHVRHLALPAPGSETQLLEMTARLASQPLDRTRPLWELYLVEGIEPAAGFDHQRFAVITKNHHALVDGISGVDLATVLLDLEPNPPEIDTAGLQPWQPHPEPNAIELIRAGLRDSARTAARMTTQLLSAAVQPSRAADVVRDAGEGLGTLAWAVLNHAPETPLNVPIGPHRRYLVIRQELADYKLVKDVFGGTVNDVVLSVVAGGLRRWLRGRGIRTEGVELRALVPVSVRTEAQRHTLGNRLALMRGPLPVYIEDPVARLAVVTQAMADLKESKQALGAAALVAVESLAPPAVLAQASRLQFSTRLFNLLVTNIPGPQVPLYILGKQLQDLFPLAFLPNGHALAIAIMSYDGRLEYGLLGDFDAMPDLDVVAEGIEAALAELVAAAGTPAGATAAPDRAPASKPRRRARTARAPRNEATAAPQTDQSPAVMPQTAGSPAVVPQTAGSPAIVPPTAQSPAMVPPTAQSPAVVPPTAGSPVVVPPTDQSPGVSEPPEPPAGPLGPASPLSLAPHHRPASGPAAELRAKGMRSTSRATPAQEKPSLPSKPAAKQGPAPRRKSL